MSKLVITWEDSLQVRERLLEPCVPLGLFLIHPGLKELFMALSELFVELGLKLTAKRLSSYDHVYKSHATHEIRANSLCCLFSSCFARE